jgi:hypothetical protein
VPPAQQQPQFSSSVNSPAPQSTQANTYHLGSEHDNPYGDEQLPFDQFNENRGDQS